LSSITHLNISQS